MEHTSSINSTLMGNLTTERRPQHSCLDADIQRNVNIYAVGVVALLGAVGNILALLVLRRSLRNSTTFILKTLAMVDLIYLCLHGTVKIIAEFPDMMLVPFVIFVPIFYIIELICAWLVVLVSIERYVAVCHPFKVKILCSLVRMKTAIVLIVMFCFAVSVPLWLEFKVTRAEDPATADALWVIDFTRMFQNKLYHVIYRMAALALVRLLLPVTIMIYSSVTITRAIKESGNMNKGHQKRDEKRKRIEREITIMVVSVVTIFVLCQTPILVSFILDTVQYVLLGKGLGIASSCMVLAGHFSLMVNSSVNFLVYVLSGPRFRQTFLKMVKCDKTDNTYSETNSANSNSQPEIENDSTKL